MTPSKIIAIVTICSAVFPPAGWMLLLIIIPIIIFRPEAIGLINSNGTHNEHHSEISQANWTESSPGQQKQQF